MRLLQSCCLLFIVCSLIGCLDPNAGKKTESDEEKSKPAGGPSALERDLDKKIAADNKSQGKAGGLPKFNENRVAGKKGLVGMMSDRVYDYHQVMKLKPELKVVTKPLGQTVYSNAYFGRLAGISKLQFERRIQGFRATNGRLPKYKEYVNEMKKMGLKLVKLPKFAIYAYNDKTGKLLILEDPAARKAHEDASK